MNRINRDSAQKSLLFYRKREKKGDCHDLSAVERDKVLPAESADAVEQSDLTRKTIRLLPFCYVSGFHKDQYKQKRKNENVDVVLYRSRYLQPQKNMVHCVHEFLTRKTLMKKAVSLVIFLLSLALSVG